MTACLISFPQDTPLDARCPRCRGEAGDHPAPLALVEHIDPEHSIFGRPTLRAALAARTAEEG